MIVFDERGLGLDASFSAHTGQDGTTLIFESRGGGKDSSNSRNQDYNPALELILSRLGRLGLRLVDAYVDSTTVQRLPVSERRLMPGRLPLDLSGLDAHQLRLELTRAQRPIGRTPNARGAGNRTRRMALVVSPAPDPDRLASELSGDAGSDLVETVKALSSISRGKGQGFSSDAAVRRVVERHAMGLAIRHYAEVGWHIEDVGDHESFDLRCTRRGCELHVEVKGTTASGASVMVTRNEVRHAQMFPTVALFIVSGIVVRRVPDGEPTAHGGRVRVLAPWVIDEECLTPLAFRYDVE